MRLSTRNRQLVLLLAIYCLVIAIAGYIYQRAVLTITMNTLELNYQQAFVSMFDKTKILAYIVPLAFMLIRVLGGGTCMYLGSFLSEKDSPKTIGDFYSIIIKAQWIIVLKEVVRVVFYIVSQGGQLNKLLMNYTSLNNLLVNRLFRDSIIYSNISGLLASIDVFQLLYWFVIAWGVSKCFNKGLGKSYLFVFKTYGIGYILFQICISFILFILK